MCKTILIRLINIQRAARDVARVNVSRANDTLRNEIDDLDSFPVFASEVMSENSNSRMSELCPADRAIVLSHAPEIKPDTTFSMVADAYIDEQPAAYLRADCSGRVAAPARRAS